MSMLNKRHESVLKEVKVDLTYVNKTQKEFLDHLESVKGINTPKNTLNIPMWLLLGLHSELSEVLNASKLHKFWNKSEINKTHLIEKLGDFLSHMGNLANFLEVDLIVEIPEIQLTAQEVIFNQLYYKITTLNWNKRHARNTLISKSLPLFVQLVYSFGFNLEDLEKVYKRKMVENYSRFN